MKRRVRAQCRQRRQIGRPMEKQSAHRPLNLSRLPPPLTPAVCFAPPTDTRPERSPGGTLREIWNGGSGHVGPAKIMLRVEPCIQPLLKLVFFDLKRVTSRINDSVYSEPLALSPSQVAQARSAVQTAATSTNSWTPYGGGRSIRRHMSSSIAGGRRF